MLDQRGRSRAELKQRLLRKNQPHGAHPGRTQAHGTPTGSPQTHGDKAHGHNLGLSGNPREVDPAVDPAVEDLIDSVLDSLQANGLINDAVFANEWVRQRSASKGKSSRALDQELKAKGVASEIRHEALSQLTEEDEEETARTFAHKKAREVKNPPADRAEYDKYLRRIVGVLARRGFPSGMSLRIAREALDDRIAAVSG
nr:regulatory protein RecX [Corynebacterium aquatimens]